LWLRPAWLNSKDFAAAAKAAGIKTVACANADEPLRGLLRFLGLSECSVDQLTPALTKAELTMLGCAEVVSQLASNYSAGRKPNVDVRKLKVWVDSAGKPAALDDIVKRSDCLARDFKDLLSEKLVSNRCLTDLISSLGYKAHTIEALISSDDERVQELPKSTVGAQPIQQPLTLTRLSIKRWRSAEQQVREILNAQDWKLEDVSRQNLGYDLEGTTREGTPAFIEVKLIDAVGQSFVLTSNEETVARQNADRYYVVLVRQTDRALEVAVIADPLHKMTLTRQCRQWVWECTNYPFEPKIIPYS
jgi:hypothetical protein